MPMTRTQLLELHKKLCDEARGIMTRKNHDYSGEKGDDPFANFRRCEAMGICTPLQGALVRLTDKFSRISTYAQSGKLLVQDETVDDTILDLINYAVLCMGMIIDQREKARMPAGILLNEVEPGVYQPTPPPSFRVKDRDSTRATTITDPWQCPKCKRWNDRAIPVCRSEFDTGMVCDGRRPDV